MPECTVNNNNAGSRNQNVYSARITGTGLIAGSPGNTKPLSTDLAARLRGLRDQHRRATPQLPHEDPQPAAGRPRLVRTVPAAAVHRRLACAGDGDRDDRAAALDGLAHGLRHLERSQRAGHVDVTEVDRQLPPSQYPGAGELPGGAEAIVMLNPDIENPDIENPDIENPGHREPRHRERRVYNPDIENPDIENPDIENPDIENPDIENPDIENASRPGHNPDIENPGYREPDIENPDIENPDIENPDIENPDIENGAIADVTWTVTNTGNTTAAFNVNLTSGQAPPCPQCAGRQPGDLSQHAVDHLQDVSDASDRRAHPRLHDREKLLRRGHRDTQRAHREHPEPSVHNPWHGNGGSEQSVAEERHAVARSWRTSGESPCASTTATPSDNLIIRNEDGTEVSDRSPVRSAHEGDAGCVSPGGRSRSRITRSPGSYGTAGGHAERHEHGLPVAPDEHCARFASRDARWRVSCACERAGMVELRCTGPHHPREDAARHERRSKRCPSRDCQALPRAITDNVDGIATFGNISVGVPGTYRLLATASASGVTALGLSNVFVINDPAIFTTLSITNWARVFSTG